MVKDLTLTCDDAWINSSHLPAKIYGATCLGGVMAILRDCGSLDLGSIPGPGLLAFQAQCLIFFHEDDMMDSDDCPRP